MRAMATIEGVARTGLWVAAMRAVESERDDRLFEDPFARALAGEEGFEALRSSQEHYSGPQVPFIEVRTHYFDARLTRAAAAGIRQFVILAAGMDARAFRLPWPAGSRVFEIDQSHVLALKDARLGNAKPTCVRTALAFDLALDWPPALVAGGFDATQRTAWLVEGLTLYLDEAKVATLARRIDALSSKGSQVLADVAGRSLLESPFMTEALARMRAIGAPWLYGTDEPQTIFAPLGWASEVTESSDYGRSIGRWPFPAAPPGMQGIPRGYFMAAEKS
jgi:methyltransferase (TIGR00027 family)